MNGSILKALDYFEKGFERGLFPLFFWANAFWAWFTAPMIVVTLQRLIAYVRHSLVYIIVFLL